jgi:hypothetical protein
MHVYRCLAKKFPEGRQPLATNVGTHENVIYRTVCVGFSDGRSENNFTVEYGFLLLSLLLLLKHKYREIGEHGLTSSGLE